MPTPPSPALADRVRSILAARRLSLAEVSRLSGSQFDGKRAFRIPANFYDALRRASFSPSLHQIFSLSVLTHYHLADWLSVFGFSFDDASRFQASWSRFHTAELDARVYNPNIHVAWFKEVRPMSLGAKLTPLNQWLNGETIQPLESLSNRLRPSFRYIKIGTRDAYAFPDLLPGSIVRINHRISFKQLLNKQPTDHILAVQHSRGIVCSRLRLAGRGRIVLCSRQLPYAPVELKLDTEARILGVVDLEIRPLASTEPPEVLPTAGRLWTPREIGWRPLAHRVGEEIRRARIQSGLSFREASKRTAEIARILQHPNYFCAPGALSDLEARDLFPRHVHKLISLSAVYCLSIAGLASLVGLQLEHAGQEAMPDDWKQASLRQEQEVPQPSGFLKAVQDTFEEVPYFLRGALPAVLGLPNLSVRDLFWAGATQGVTHPYLRNCVFLAVNRRDKTPTQSLSSPVWAQPLYVLETRDGKRLCAACSLQNGTLVVRPCTSIYGDLVRLRNRVDAEVIGRVMATVRLLRSRRDVDPGI
jgi:hypothetical protein